MIFSDLQWKTRGDLGAFYGGLTGKNKNDFSNGNAKFISYMNVFSNIATNFKVNDFVKIGESENQNTIQYGDILFTGSSESLEECGMSSVVNEEVKENVYLNSFCFGYRFHNSELFLPNFLKFLFRSEKIRKQIVKTANGVTRFNVSKKKMEKIQIPIPPIEEQERIAGILDKFDTLVNSISEGLPREIELRRKQYEYYREKLLSFPKN
ncbi:MAG: restriction endonuclease subunit S [Flavobacteriaceae bacterium]|nr:restriction endonuclease subunit S [Flavobacteriaceae bacterium]